MSASRAFVDATLLGTAADRCRSRPHVRCVVGRATLEEKKSPLERRAIWVHAGPARLPTSRLLAGERGSCHLRCHATEVVQGLATAATRGTHVINHRETSDATAMPRTLLFFFLVPAVSQRQRANRCPVPVDELAFG